MDISKDESAIAAKLKADLQILENAPKELNSKFIAVWDTYKVQCFTFIGVSFALGFCIAKIF
jgi:hypothetical protein